MKIIICLFFSTLILTDCHSQERLANEEFDGTQFYDLGKLSNDPKGPSKVDSTLGFKNVPVIALPKMNVIYREIENPILISVPGVESDNLIVSADQGVISGKSGRYTILLKYPTNEVRVTVMAVHGVDTVNYGKQTFRVKRIPNPMARFMGRGGDDKTIRKGKVLDAVGIRARTYNVDYYLDFVVKSFILIIEQNGIQAEFASYNNRLTQDMKIKLREVKEGDIVYFREIQAQGPSDLTRKLDDLEFLIVD